jgi:hypothetical protein
MEAGTEAPVLCPEAARAVAEGRVTPISIGPNCNASYMLDHLGLRQAAYPFDWLVSSLAVVEHCLSDDFQTFLDPSQYRPRDERGTDHGFYLDTFGVESMFLHHRMPDASSHFERAVERFRAAPNPVFVYMSTAEDPDEAALARVRSRLRGPLLAYLLLSPYDADPGRADLPTFRMTAKLYRVSSKRLFELADESGLSKRLAEDVLALAASPVT